MRARIGFIFLALISSVISPVIPSASAFGGYASAPTSVTQSAISGGIRVTWSAPVDVDSGIIGYRVEYSTSGTSGTWNLATTTSSSASSYDIVGLPQSATYIRVAGTTSAGTGAYGYPWALIYSTSSLRRDSSGNVSYDSGYGLASLGGQASNTYASANYTRVKYLLQTTISGTAKYVESDFYTWPSGGATGSTAATSAPTISGIAVPSVNAGQQWNVQANISDLNVYSDNSMVSKTKSANGRLEIWPWDYQHGPSGLSPSGTNNSYDFDDAHVGNGSFGSFQVHDLTNNKPVFVWNNTGYSNYYSAEVAYGLNSGTNPDWTFCSQGGAWGTCATPSSFNLKIYINPSVMPLQDATPPTASRVDIRSLGKNGDTITVRSTEVGNVYLVNQSVSVSNLASITNASAANRNSVAISSANSSTTLTISSLNDGLYNLYAADLFSNLSTAIVGTIRIDNTAPATLSIAVNSSGTAIILTANETITNSSQVLNIYSVSDSGSALSISSTTFSGAVATLNLSRAIPAGASVTFSYAPSGGSAGGRWVDLAGNEMAAISLRSITNNSAAPITVSLTVPDVISKGVTISVSAIVSVSGKVTFTVAGKRIPGCINRSAAGATPITVTCSFKPGLSTRQVIAAVLTPTLGAYPVTTSTVERFILKRSTRR